VVQWYEGTGKMKKLKRARALLDIRGFDDRGLAPAAQMLASELASNGETLQRFLVRNEGVADGPLTRKDAREMRTAFKTTVLVGTKARSPRP